MARPGTGTVFLSGCLALLLLLCGCQAAEPGGVAADREAAEDATGGAVDPALGAVLRRATALADSVEDLLRPVPLLRESEEEELRSYPNEVHIRTARRLGVRPAGEEELASLLSEGRLVELEDSTRYWVLRELTASRPLVTPQTRDLLERLGERFQDRLGEMGLPAYRFEISSVLRTPESQAALRRRNENAAAGTSSHEFGTTVDIPYSAYAAPAELPEGLVAYPDRAELELVARLALDRMAARKSRELKAILGGVLREAQSRGEVLVTLERLQPVYHITVNDGG